MRSTVIGHAILTIGQLSEEAAETRNKHFRKYRKKLSPRTMYQRRTL